MSKNTTTHITIERLAADIDDIGKKIRFPN
jgi:hypothetical protein